ncbi:MAG: hypothetical protein ACR2NR_21045, partial [Solirubrobacteraceae bacterium]
RPGDFGGKIVSSERAARELGWSAATPFAVGVARYIDWRHEQATFSLADLRVEATVTDDECEDEALLSA